MINRTERFGFREVRRVAEDHKTDARFRPFISDELVMVKSVPFQVGVVSMDTPYIIEDVRLLKIISGKAKISVNLVESAISAGDMVVADYGTLFQIRDASPDLEFVAIMIGSSLLQQMLGERTMDILHAEGGVARIGHTAAEGQLADTMLDTIWTLLQAYGYQPGVMRPALLAYMEFLEMLYQREQGETEKPADRGQTAFNRFITLVNKYSQREHAIDFYADKMCISSHYLGSLVKQQSGLTAKEWIDKAVITQAKMLLKSTDLQSSQIADRLAFANPSFFSKYFKRLTGMTPQEYRES